MYLNPKVMGKAAAPPVLCERILCSKEQVGNLVLPQTTAHCQERNIPVSHTGVHGDLQWYV